MGLLACATCWSVPPAGWPARRASHELRPCLARSASSTSRLRSGRRILALGAARIDIVRGTRVVAGPASLWTEAQLADSAGPAPATGSCRAPAGPPASRWSRPRSTSSSSCGSIETSGSDLTPTYQPYARFAAANVALELRDPDTGDSDASSTWARSTWSPASPSSTRCCWGRSSATSGTRSRSARSTLRPDPGHRQAPRAG